MDSSGNHFAQISLDRSPSYLVFFHSLRERERERDFKSLIKKKKDKDLCETHLESIFVGTGKDEFARLTNGQRSSTVMQLNP